MERQEIQREGFVGKKIEMGQWGIDQKKQGDVWFRRGIKKGKYKLEHEVKDSQKMSRDVFDLFHE